jgi:ADP-glucose pyrophosphorylase
VGEGSTVDEAVVLAGARIGSNCRLQRVVIDEGVVIPDGTVVETCGEVTLLANTPVPSQSHGLRSVA